MTRMGRQRNRQREDRLVAFVAAYQAREGRPPTYREIATGIGSELSVVYAASKRLVAEGRLVRRGRMESRSLFVP